MHFVRQKPPHPHDNNKISILAIQAISTRNPPVYPPILTAPRASGRAACPGGEPRDCARPGAPAGGAAGGGGGAGARDHPCQGKDIYPLRL